MFCVRVLVERFQKTFAGGPSFTELTLRLLTAMAKEGTAVKYDPNTEIFQMRAQWKKMDNCRKQWFERWGWLCVERSEILREMKAIKEEVAEMLPRETKEEYKKSLKPLPASSAGVIGWLSTRSDCQLEMGAWKIGIPPIRLPDVWDNKDFVG